MFDNENHKKVGLQEHTVMQNKIVNFVPIRLTDYLYFKK